jgi:hypothetical protein
MCYDLANRIAENRRQSHKIANLVAAERYSPTNVTASDNGARDVR